MDSEKQKRSHERLKHPFVAKLKLYNEAAGDEKPRWEVVTIRNISPGGLSFNYTQKFSIGAVLELDIGLSTTLGTVHCLATVCRIDELPPKRPDIKTIPIYGIAVRFNNLSDEKKEAIERLIRQFHISA